MEDKMGYKQTLMTGHYVTDELADLARRLQRQRIREKQRMSIRKMEEIDHARMIEQMCCYKACVGGLFLLRRLVHKIGEDWVFLALLGLIMALLSFAVEYTVFTLLRTQRQMYEVCGELHPFLQYCVWVAFPVLLVLFSVNFVQVVSPSAVGSGIPEMKTILRGVVLKEYLTFRTLVSKVVGLTAALGSGLPIGRVGPFVHIASLVATVLSKASTTFRGIYENESRRNEMLAAACATGVSCAFAAPIGGVLFSIEVTTTLFAVRNYWRGFFSAMCAALLFRLFTMTFDEETDTVTAWLKITLHTEFPFDHAELLAFAGIGVVCGLGGSLFVLTHRKIVLLSRRNKAVSEFLQNHRGLYPLLVTIIISSLTCPLTVGQYMGGGYPFRTALEDLFSNFTWSNPNTEMMTFREQAVISRWNNPSIWVSLLNYALFLFLMSATAITLPIPAGIFFPTFTLGAALGRIVGEGMYMWFPHGINKGLYLYDIIPAGYSMVGAAAFSGAVTHTISTAVIAFELTGQMSHILPCVLAVLIANAIANRLQPSIYDSIIQLRRLPYLPDLLPTNTNIHKIKAEDFMKRDVKFIGYDTKYEDLRLLLDENLNLQTFPLVSNKNDMILIGSVQRFELMRMFELQLGRKRRECQSATGEQAAEILSEKEIIPKSRKRHSSESSRDFKMSFKQRFSRSKSQLDDGLSQTSIDSMKEARSDQCIAKIAHPVKSILKKSETNPDFGLPHSGRTMSDSVCTLTDVSLETFNTVVGADNGDTSKGKKAATLPLDGLFKVHHHESLEALNTDVDDMDNVSNNFSVKSVRLPPSRIIDLPVEEQLQWESEQLQALIDLSQCQIDPAPFQLVEKSSLYKVHSLFTLLGLSHAYVTNVGRLVGIVALKELRGVISGPSIIAAPIIDTPRIPGPNYARRGSALNHTVGGVPIDYKMRDLNTIDGEADEI